MATPKKTEHPQVELQIAPMIDVCFLLLFFYILTSKPVKPEADVSTKLPGSVSQEESVDLPDEQRIEIRANGQVVLNEQTLDSPTDSQLPQLLETLKRYKEASDANQAEALVTLFPEDGVVHQRIIDVMNTCALAGIKGVTFASDPEDDFDL
ncbi:MAG: biopolymer transporter ExbD [Verrucomicrobiae bacterium]|nr:biopolymer transporter ExbD [Verrucomicrobiae bacterium]